MTLLQALALLLAAAFGAVLGSLLTWRWLQHGPAARRPQPATNVAPPPPEAKAAARAAVAPRPRVTEPPTRPAAGPAPPLAADVLVVDDSAVARAKLRRLLEGQGYSVHLACDGLEALQRLEAGRYGLMISDLEMPNMDGVTLINICLAQPRTARMPMLAVSGHENLRARFNECKDICGVHRKPWVDDVLASHVATLLGRPPRRAAETPQREAAPA